MEGSQQQTRRSHEINSRTKDFAQIRRNSEKGWGSNLEAAAKSKQYLWEIKNLYPRCDLAILQNKLGKGNAFSIPSNKDFGSFQGIWAQVSSQRKGFSNDDVRRWKCREPARKEDNNYPLKAIDWQFQFRDVVTISIIKW